MKTKDVRFYVSHIDVGPTEIHFRTTNGRAVKVRKGCREFEYPSNFLLLFQKAKLDVTYIYGTDIPLEMKLDNQTIYQQSREKFSQWQKFFEGKDDLQIDIDLALSCYDENEGLLVYNLSQQNKNVFRYREEILLRQYANAIPKLVQRLKIENNLIYAVCSSYFKVFATDLSQKMRLEYCLKECSGLNLEFDCLEKWYLEEMMLLDKLYQQDKENGCHQDLSRIQESRIIRHSSELIPITISDDAINAFKKVE